MVVWIIVIATSVGIDQLTKALISTSYSIGESHVIIPHLINFSYIRNEGAAWGIFSNNRWIFIVISAILIIILPIILYKFRKLHFLFGFSLSLIIGGAIGNMVDRVFFGSVIDFIEFEFINFPIFNFADICVTVGAVLMFIYLIFIDKTLLRSNKSKKDGTQTDAGSKEIENGDAPNNDESCKNEDNGN